MYSLVRWHIKTSLVFLGLGMLLGLHMVAGQRLGGERSHARPHRGAHARLACGFYAHAGHGRRALDVPSSVQGK